jgi:protocatechuate 3,4-dioxygenase, beta subunit
MLLFDRRKLIGGLGLGAGVLAMPGLLRAQSTGATAEWTRRDPTAFQPEGPYYPYDDMPSDLDADLVRLAGMDAQAQGQVAHVTGTVWDMGNNPRAGALIEIWQCDNNGRYIHREDTATDRARDPGFQGYGKAMTDANGRFHFRTIKPVSYAAVIGGREVLRAPHIHVAVSTRGVRRLTSQLYVEGEPLNDSDGLLQGLTTPTQRMGIVRPFVADSSMESGAVSAHYDIVVAV